MPEGIDKNELNDLLAVVDKVIEAPDGMLDGVAADKLMVPDGSGVLIDGMNDTSDTEEVLDEEKPSDDAEEPSDESEESDEEEEGEAEEEEEEVDEEEQTEAKKADEESEKEEKAEEGEEKDELDTLEEENEDLRKALNEMAEGWGKDDKPTPEPDTTPPADDSEKTPEQGDLPVSQGIVEFIKDEKELEAAIDSPRAMNTLLTKVYAAGAQNAVRSMTKSVEKTIDRKIYLAGLHADFYTRNSDLKGCEHFTNQVCNELGAKHPEWDWPHLFDETAIETRRRLRRVAPSADKQEEDAGPSRKKRRRQARQKEGLTHKGTNARRSQGRRSGAKTTLNDEVQRMMDAG